jgi:hypothetical protein
MSFSNLRDSVQRAAMAAANLVSRELDREPSDGDTVSQRAQDRARGVAFDLAAKLTLSHSAQELARAGARRLPQQGIGRAFGVLAKRPAAAAGVALFTYDAVRDTVRLSRGDIDSNEFVERASGNAFGLGCAAGGAFVGAALGAVVIPIVGAPLGGFVGGMIGGIGGDATGRTLARQVSRQRRQSKARKTHAPRQDKKTSRKAQ